MKNWLNLKCSQIFRIFFGNTILFLALTAPSYASTHYDFSANGSTVTAYSMGQVTVDIQGESTNFYVYFFNGTFSDTQSLLTDTTYAPWWGNEGLANTFSSSYSDWLSFAYVTGCYGSSGVCTSLSGDAGYTQSLTDASYYAFVLSDPLGSSPAPSGGAPEIDGDLLPRALLLLAMLALIAGWAKLPAAQPRNMSGSLQA